MRDYRSAAARLCTSQAAMSPAGRKKVVVMAQHGEDRCYVLSPTDAGNRHRRIVALGLPTPPRLVWRSPSTSRSLPTDCTISPRRKPRNYYLNSRHRVTEEPARSSDATTSRTEGRSHEIATRSLNRSATTGAVGPWSRHLGDLCPSSFPTACTMRSVSQDRCRKLAGSRCCRVNRPRRWAVERRRETPYRAT